MLVGVTFFLRDIVLLPRVVRKIRRIITVVSAVVVCSIPVHLVVQLLIVLMVLVTMESVQSRHHEGLRIHCRWGTRGS
jgi:hypothetical protein